MKLEDHPTVQAIRQRNQGQEPPEPQTLDAASLKRMVLDAGADDVGLVEIARPALDGFRSDLRSAMMELTWRVTPDLFRETDPHERFQTWQRAPGDAALAISL